MRMLAAPGAIGTSLSDGGSMSRTPQPVTHAGSLRSVRGTPPPPDVGERTFEFRVPDGMQLEKAQAIALPESSKGAAVLLMPGLNKGGTGNQQIKVWYSIPPGGTLRLRVRAYGKPQPTPGTGHSEQQDTEILYIRDQQSVDRMSSLMASKERFIIVIDGPDVPALESTGLFADGLTWEVSNGLFGPEVKFNPVITSTVLITLIITAGVVAVVLIVFFTALLAMAIAHCYKIHVSSMKLGDISFGGVQLSLELPSLVFDLEPTACS